MAELSCTGILWLTLSTLAALGASSGFFLPYWLRGTYPHPPPSPPSVHYSPDTPSSSSPHNFNSPTLTNPVPVFLNSWRRCNYPKLVTASSATVTDDAGGVRRRSDDGDDDDDDDGGGVVRRGKDGSFGRSMGAAAAAPPPPRPRVEVVPECGRYTRFTDIPSLWWQVGTVICGTGSALALLVAMAGAWALCVRYVMTQGTAKVAAGVQVVAGLLIGGGVALYPLGWGSPEVRQVCGASSSAFRMGDCELYWAFYLTASAGGVTLLCSTLAICAPTSKTEAEYL